MLIILAMRIDSMFQPMTLGSLGLGLGFMDMDHSHSRANSHSQQSQSQLAAMDDFLMDEDDDDDSRDGMGQADTNTNTSSQRKAEIRKVRFLLSENRQSHSSMRCVLHTRISFANLQNSTTDSCIFWFL